MKKLSYFQWFALKECWSFPDGKYVWKQTTLSRLARYGLTAPKGHGNVLTLRGRELVAMGWPQAGQVALEEMEIPT
jgi:hypothetical protein